MNYQILQNIVNEHLEIFKTISEEQWSYKPAPEKWSKREILGHLCDSAINNIRRMVVTQYQENLNIVYDQDFWVKAQNYQNRETEDVINLWKSLQEQVVSLVENTPENALEKTCDVSKNEHTIVTLKFIIDDYASHQLYHLEAIKRK